MGNPLDYPQAILPEEYMDWSRSELITLVGRLQSKLSDTMMECDERHRREELLSQQLEEAGVVPWTKMSPAEEMAYLAAEDELEDVEGRDEEDGVDR